MAQNNITGHEGRKRVFLVEEHAMFRRGLALVIEDEPGLTVCGEMDSPVGALEAIQQAQPDVLIVGMPTRETAYAELVRNVGEQHTNLPILVMTDSWKSREEKAISQRGNVAYVRKQEDVGTVLDALRRILPVEKGRGGHGASAPSGAI